MDFLLILDLNLIKVLMVEFVFFLLPRLRILFLPGENYYLL